MEDDDLLQTDFMKGSARPAPTPTPAPATAKAPPAAKEEDDLLNTDFMRSFRGQKPAEQQPAPQQPAASARAPNQPSTFAPNQVDRPEPKEMAWGDVASSAAQNIVPSAKAFGQALVTPFMQPKETAQALGQIGTGLYSKARGALGYTQTAEEKAKDEAAVNQMGQLFKERYGTVEAAKRTFAEDPVGFLADVSTPLTGGGSLAARAPGVIGTLGKATAAVGSAIDPVAAALKVPQVATKAITTATNVPLSLQSGVSYRSLQQAVDSGANASPVFWEHLSGSVPASSVVDRVNNAIGQVAKQRSDDYIREMTAATGRNPQQLSYGLVDKAMTDAQNIAMPRGLVFDPTASKVVVFNKVKNLVDDWKANPNNGHTMADFDQLKKDLRTFGYDNTLPGSEARKMVEDLANSAKATIPDKKYVDIMEQYQAATRELNDLNKDLVNRRGSTTSQISKILKNQDKQSKGALIKRLEELDPDLPAAIAGVELNPLIPSGLRGQLAGMLASGSFLGLAGMAAHPAPLAGIALSSPRVAGTLNYGAGRIAGAPARTYESLRPAVEAARQSGRAEDVLGPQPQARGGRARRASGGRLTGITTAAMLMAAAESAKKGHGKATEPLLNQPDEAITRALAIANQHS
jgi:hypothetical protein